MSNPELTPSTVTSPTELRERYFRHANTAYDDEAWSEIKIPLETPNSALAQYVNLAAKPLFEVFNGYNPSPPIVEELTRKIFERRY